MGSRLWDLLYSNLFAMAFAFCHFGKKMAFDFGFDLAPCDLDPLQFGLQMCLGVFSNMFGTKWDQNKQV